jgi:hypothetical protein
MVCSLPHRYAHRVEGGLENSSLIGASLSMWSGHMRARSIAFALSKRRLQLHLRRLVRAGSSEKPVRRNLEWTPTRCSGKLHVYFDLCGQCRAHSNSLLVAAWTRSRVRDLIAKRHVQFLTVSRASPND